MTGADGNPAEVEPPPSPDAPAGMSAELRISGALQRAATPINPGGAPGPGDAAFDRWLQRELSKLYDDALSEPVPDDLLRLLGEGSGGR